MNQSVNYVGVCRTAPATPGLLITQNSSVSEYLSFSESRAIFVVSELINPGLLAGERH